MSKFYSNGKLLLTGEYLVLDGATALAVPTKYGQSLIVENRNPGVLGWTSQDEKGNLWFEGSFTLDGSNVITKDKSPTAERLSQILNAAIQQSPDFKDQILGKQVTTKMDFPRDWGLGSSSTLINNIAQWAEVDAFELSKKTFGGSGYDIACAKNNTPIRYSKQKTEPVVLGFPFVERLYFIHLNQKQNSRQAIAHYRNQPSDKKTAAISRVSEISHLLPELKTLAEFEKLLLEHEQLLSGLLNLETVQSKLFPDYPGVVKSLGGWGGDFVLASDPENSAINYFSGKGFDTVAPYGDMVLG